MRLGVWIIYGCAGRFYQEADEGVYRQGDYAGMAVSPWRADRRDS